MTAPKPRRHDLLGVKSGALSKAMSSLSTADYDALISTASRKRITLAEALVQAFVSQQAATRTEPRP